MHTTETIELLVRKDQLSNITVRATDLGPLADGKVRVAIDHFALTSNNITYAAMGDAMQYWQFFPVTDTGDGIAWGRIPVWGFATVQASRHPDVMVGERLYGYFPMSAAVDLEPAKVTAASFLDAAPHRAALHRVYNQYMRCASDPFYSADTEDIQSLLRPLFTTSWLIDDFMADNDFFGAAAHGGRPVLLLSSASSKTAYGTAFQLFQRDGVEVVGLTSEANVAFCESLGCYHRVLTYNQLESIAPDAPAIYIDFAGNAPLRKAIHTHCTGLRYSCSIGATHLSDMGGAKDLPGPKATLFFAPAQIKKRSDEWGAAVLGQRLVHAWQAFIARVSQPDAPWLRVVHHTGPAAVQAAYLEVLGGKGDPRVGHVLTLNGSQPEARGTMSAKQYPVAVVAAEVAPRSKPSNYPEPFASRMAGREKRQLGEVFGLANFGVNLTRLAPHAASALRHAHSRQDEFIYILQGRPTLHTDEGKMQLSPGMCAGFKAATGNAHRLVNETAEEVVYLEVGDRSPGDGASYPDDDLQAILVDGQWTFAHKDGTPYW